MACRVVTDWSCVHCGHLICPSSQGKCCVSSVKAWRSKGQECQLKSDLLCHSSWRTGGCLTTTLTHRPACRTKETRSPCATAAARFPFPWALWAPGEGENLRLPRRKANFITFSFLISGSEHLCSSRKVSLWLTVFKLWLHVVQLWY